MGLHLKDFFLLFLSRKYFEVKVQQKLRLSIIFFEMLNLPEYLLKGSQNLGWKITNTL